jgi:hypothetical protein
MSHPYDKFIYCLTYKTQFAERLTKGFTGGNYSTDGNWVIGDKGSTTDMNMWCTYDDSLVPQWMKDLGVTECCLTHELAQSIVNTLASAEGASDGWYFNEDI